MRAAVHEWTFLFAANAFANPHFFSCFSFNGERFACSERFEKSIKAEFEFENFHSEFPFMSSANCAHRFRGWVARYDTISSWKLSERSALEHWKVYHDYCVSGKTRPIDFPSLLTTLKLLNLVFRWSDTSLWWNCDCQPAGSAALWKVEIIRFIERGVVRARWQNLIK